MSNSELIDMSSNEWHINNECPVCDHAWMDKAKPAGHCPSCETEYTMEGTEIPGAEITISWQLPVFYAIVQILEKHGFKLQTNGDVTRDDTGCVFYFKSLVKYKTVVDFQLDWRYT